MNRFVSDPIRMRSALATLIVLCACSSTQRLSADTRAALRTVAVDTQVAVPAAMYFYGEGERTASRFGVLGALTNAALGDRPEDRIAALERESGISIGEIVRAEFIRQLEQRGTLQLGEPAQASLELEVLSYGMSVPGSFSSGMVPMLSVRATLSDSEQRVLWTTKQGISVWGNPVQPQEQYLQERNPDRLRRFWRSAAEAVTRELLDTLQP